jgi:predicted membrane protein
MPSICPPALIYIVFSVTQILIDLIKGLYNTALMKFIVMTIIGFLLNVLCQGGLGIISWIIVFIPFILMTIVVALLLYAFGLNATTGTFSQNLVINNEDIEEVVISPQTSVQSLPSQIDSRCVMIQGSTPQHGMKTTFTDNIYCPWGVYEFDDDTDSDTDNM